MGIMLNVMKRTGFSLNSRCSLLLCLYLFLAFRPVAADVGYTEPTIDSIFISCNLMLSEGDILHGTGLHEGIAQYQITSTDVRQTVLNNFRYRGYLEAEVQIVWPSWTDETGIVGIYIDSGNKSIIGPMVFSGNTIFPTGELVRLLEAEPGELLTPAVLAGFEQNILDSYRQRGYVRAIIDVSPSPFDSTLPDSVVLNRGIEVRISENTQVRLGSIQIQGLETVRKKVVLREILLAPGDSLDMEILRETISSIYRLGLFYNVRFNYQGLEEGNDVVGLVVVLTERDYKTVDIGGGYLSPAAITAGITWRHPNIMGNNQRLIIDLKGTKYLSGEGGQEYEPSITYEEPYFISTRWTARLSADYLYKELPGISERSYGIEISFFNKLTRNLTYGVGYRVERSRFSEEGSVFDWTTSAIISTSLIHDTRDNPFSPRYGHRMSGEAELAGILVGGRQYYRLVGEARVFKPVKRNFILAWRLRSGIVEPYGGYDTVEPDDRFFLGGGTTVRGYGFNTLGPEDNEGNSLGGRIMILGNFETRIKLMGFLGFAFFVDSGGLWNSFDDMTINNMGLGTGVGLRLETPFGPFRIDYGFAPTWREGYKRGRLHIALGQAF